MATIFLESGTDATQGFEFYSATTNSPVSDSSVFHTPPRSIKCSSTSNMTVSRNNVLADAGRRISFWFRFDTAPAATSSVCQILQSGGTSVFQLTALTSSKLRISPTGATTVDGNTVLNTNTWYRIAIAYTITNTTTFRFDLYINGVLESSATAGTMTNVTSNLFRMVSATTWGASANVWFDDIYIDDIATYGDPGNIIVINKRPNANGVANQFTTQIGAGSSGYGTGHSSQVNEQPLSSTNGWSIASASALSEQYTIEGAATGDKDVSNPRYKLVDYVGWIYAKTTTAGTRNIIVNGSATNITATTAYALYTKAAGSTTYPSGNTAIGMNNNSVNNLTSLAECGILLAYKLPRRVSITP